MIPRTIKLLLEGFDLGWRLLLLWGSAILRLYALPTGRAIAESGRKFIGLAPLVRALLRSPLQSMPLKPAQSSAYYLNHRN